MARKSKSAEDKRRIHYLHIDPKDVDLNWLHSMRKPEEKKRDKEIAEWFKRRLSSHESRAKKLPGKD